jgi:hypothetical protein
MKLFCFHKRGEPVSIPPTEEQIEMGRRLDAVRIFIRPSITCSKCGKEINRTPNREDCFYVLADGTTVDSFARPLGKMTLTHGVS